MKKISLLLTALLLIVSMIASPLSSITAEAATPIYKELPKKTNVAIDKEWSIKLNSKLDLQTITRDNVYVVDDRGVKQKTSAVLSKDKKTIIVQPPEEGYNKNTHYTLYVTTGVASLKEKFIQEPIKMEFETNGSANDEFVADPQMNNIVYTKKVDKLSTKTINKLTTSDYTKSQIAFNGKLKEVKDLSKNDIIILPPTDEYPFGYAKKVTNVSYKGSSTVVNVKEPSIEEVVDDKTEISTEKDISLDDIDIDTSQVAGLYLKKSSAKEKVYAVKGEEFTKYLKLTKNSNESITVSYNDIPLKLGSKKTIKGHEVTLKDVTLNGSITMDMPKLYSEGSIFNLSYLQFKAKIVKEMNVNYGINVENCSRECKEELLEDAATKQEIEKVIPTGIKIPVKLYGVVGAEIALELVGKGSLSGDVSAGFNLTGKIDVGFKENARGVNKGFNKSSASANIEAAKLEVKAEVKGGIRVSVKAKILQFQLGEIDGDVGVGLALTGTADTGFSVSAAADKDSSEEGGVNFNAWGVCVKIEAKFYTTVSGEVGRNPYVYKFDLIDLEKPLYESSTCDATSLRTSPRTLNITSGDTEKLTLSTVTKNLKETEVELPDKEVKMTIKDENIATVDRYGNVVINKNAKPGDKTTLHIQYGNLEKEVDINVVKPSEFGIEGFVKSSTDNKILPNVNLVVKNTKTNEVVHRTYTDKEGKYDFRIKKGEYTIAYSKDEYKTSTRTFKIDGDSEESEKLDAVTLVPVNTENVTIKGKATDAVTGEALSDVTLEFFNQVDIENNIIKPRNVVVTNANGDYETILEEGVYKVSIKSSDSYMPYTKEIVVNKNELSHNFPLVPLLKLNNMRIVLSWGENPEDLDSHLYGPTKEGTDIFHIYYEDQGTDPSDDDGTYGANLDLDDTSSYGPETITIYDVHAGVYRYLVHHYYGDGTLTTSGANVQVYFDEKQNAPIKEFKVPLTGEGYYWHVFDIDAKTGKIYEVNEILQSNPME